MALPLVLLVVICFAWGIPQDCAGQRYAILAPRTVRSDSLYNVVLTNVGPAEQEFRLEIVNSKGAVQARTQQKVKGKDLTTVNLNVTHLTRDEYKLKVLNQRTNEVLNTTDLAYEDRRYMVLFQTDKPLYKPGDRVQFRVIFLFSDTKPVWSAHTPSVHITNPDRIRIKQWANVTLTSGVFVGSFQLAEYTSPGRWTIGATINRQEYKETFRVEEYTLPLFAVQLHSVPNSYFICTDKNMTLKISANYAHGGLVRGKAIVAIRANYNNYPSDTVELQRVEVPITGTTTVSFNTDIVAKNCDEEHSVWFDVEVIESMTGISYNASKSYTIYNSHFTMELVDAIDAFYPGTPLALKVRLTTIDGTPIVKAPVSVQYKVLKEGEIDSDKTIAHRADGNSNENGIFRFTINTTLSTGRVIAEGTYRSQQFWLLDASPMYEDKTVEYLAATTKQVYFIVSNNVKVDFYSNVNVMHIFYVAYCHGTHVCSSGSMKAPEPARYNRLEFVATAEMMPEIKLLAFTVKEDGKILSTTIPVRISPSSRTFNVAATYLPNEPNGSYNFNINAEKGAFVGLLGVDQRMHQRGVTAMNDITWQKLSTMLDSQEDTSTLWSYYDSFGTAAVTLLTNGYIQDVGYVPHSVNQFERNANLAEGESVENMRRDFPETWLWENFIAASGKTSLIKPLPSTVTTWMVSAFSVGQQNGLQILRTPLRLKSKTKQIVAELHAPPSIKRFEEVTAYCLVHNFDQPVNVTLEVRPMLSKPLRLYLAKGATESVRVTLSPLTFDPLTVDIIVRNTKGKVLDALQRTIPVRPEGIQRTVEDVRLLTYPSSTSENFTLWVPPIEGDRKRMAGVVTLSAIGTFLNLNMFDLEEMVRSSHGNGEESLLFLQTAMAVYDYRLKSNRLPAESKDQLISHMEVAYQQLLRYRLDDGSFSMFGTMYRCGGVWFTASTIESLCMLSTYMPVERSVIDDGLSWLALQSEEDGRFNETCTIAHPHIQRAGGKELSLAGSVLLAFVRANATKDYEPLVNKIVSLLETVPNDDVYLLAKTSYLLTMIGHTGKHKMIETLNNHTVLVGSYQHWSVTERQSTASPELRDQETTVYALLANLKVSQLLQTQLINIAQWIQQHSFAGDHWVSSLEKVLALQALGMLVDNIPTGKPSMSITVQNQRDVLKINGGNQDLLQTITLPSGTTSVMLSTSGTGLALIRLCYRYNVLSAPADSSTEVQVQKRSTTNSALHIHMCFIWRRLAYANISRLWQLSVLLPTGYEVQQLIETDTEHVRSVSELRKKSTLVIVLEDSPHSKTCFTITAVPRWDSPQTLTGTIQCSSFDTKDIAKEQQF